MTALVGQQFRALNIVWIHLSFTLPRVKGKVVRVFSFFSSSGFSLVQAVHGLALFL